MEISKFVVGVLTIAIGLWAAGQLAPATLSLASKAVAAQKDHQEFRLGDWNRRLNR
jgi:galactitol-specific phosphotransferase system IIC component